MTEALRDQNHVPTLLGVSDADGITPLPINANASTHGLEIDDGVGGSDLSDEPAPRDQNRVVVLMAVSAVDGVTPVPIYATDITNHLKVRST